MSLFLFLSTKNGRTKAQQINMGEGIPQKASFQRKRLRWRTQTFAGAVANVCRNGCNALRLRWVKLAPKSPVLFYKVSDLHTDDHSGAVWKAIQQVPPIYACQNLQNGGGARHLFHYTHRCPLCHKAGCVQDGRSGLPHLRSPDGKLHREKWG